MINLGYVALARSCQALSLFRAVAAVAGIAAAGVLASTAAAQVTANVQTVHQFGVPALYSPLTLGSDGNYYGISAFGGSYGYGFVYQATSAGAVKTLASFNGTTSGSYVNPTGFGSTFAAPPALAQAGDGNFYGTTTAGGANGAGTVFKMTPAGVLTTLHSFDPRPSNSGSERNPVMFGVTVGSDGALYGVTDLATGSGSATRAIYRLTTAGGFSVLSTSVGGGSPLVLGANGNLYGLAGNELFQITTAGVVTVIYTDQGGEISGVVPALVQGSDGAFYGQGTSDGSHSRGGVFKITLAGVYTILHSFDADASEGYSPVGALAAGSDGAVYGVATQGGFFGAGSIYRVTAAGSYSTVYNFGANDPKNQRAGLIKGSDGAFFGTTLSGPTTATQGSIYRVTAAGDFSTLYTFNQAVGAAPRSALVKGGDGNFYGTTDLGGTNNAGTIYRMTPAGALSTLRNLAASPFGGGSNGASIVAAGDGNLYGTTTVDGTQNSGTVYRLTTAGAFTVLHDFTGGADGSYAGSDVRVAPDGSLYSITSGGGANGFGTLFDITTDGTFATVYSFTTDLRPAITPVLLANGSYYGIGYMASDDPSTPTYYIYKLTAAGVLTTLYTFPTGQTLYDSSLLLASDGNLYGTTRLLGSGSDSVFRLTPAGVLTTLLTFNGNFGSEPNGLVEGSDGFLYGTVQFGGQTDYGNIYRLSKTGSYTPLHNFNAALGGPSAALFQDDDGTFYGPALYTDDGVPPSAIYRFDLKPAITSAATATGVVGTAFSYQAAANNNPTSYTASTLPAGLSFNTGTGAISGTPTKAGIYSVTLTATNTLGAGKAFTLTLNITLPPPVITSATSASARVGTAFTYQITATNTPATYGADFLPDGLSLDTATGKITGTPAADSDDEYFITISATNSGGTGMQELDLVVKPALPAITSSLTASGQTGVAFSYRITASNHPKTFGASGLPAGLQVDQNTGVISGTPTAAGTFTVTLAAFSSAGSGSASLKLTIAAGKPVITSTLTASATTGKAFTYQITASASPTKYGASGLPAGLSLDQTTGRISGAPSAAGTFPVTIAAFNAAGSGSAKLTLTVKLGSPVITSATSASATTGKAFSYQVVASGSPTKYGASGLPAGLALDQTTGKITGTPAAAGTFTVTIAAFNSVGSGSAKLTLTVALGSPTITSALTATPKVGSPFSYQVTATGSPTKYGASGLPAGLALNQTTGKISGTPAKAGSYSVTVAAFNSVGSGTAKLAVTVAAQ